MAQDDDNFFDGLITPPEALIGPAFTDFVACKAVSITTSILLLCMFLIYFYCCMTGSGSVWRGRSIIEKLGLHTLFFIAVSLATSGVVTFYTMPVWKHSNKWTCRKSIQTSLICYLVSKGALNFYLVDRLYALDPRGPRSQNRYYIYGVLSILIAHIFISTITSLSYTTNISKNDSQCHGGIHRAFIFLIYDLVVKSALIGGTMGNLHSAIHGLAPREIVKIFFRALPIYPHILISHVDQLRLRLGQSIWGIIALIPITTTFMALNLHTHGRVQVSLFIIFCNIEFLWASIVALWLSYEEVITDPPITPPAPLPIPSLIPNPNAFPPDEAIELSYFNGEEGRI